MSSKSLESGASRNESCSIPQNYPFLTHSNIQPLSEGVNANANFERQPSDNDAEAYRLFSSGHSSANKCCNIPPIYPFIINADVLPFSGEVNAAASFERQPLLQIPSDKDTEINRLISSSSNSEELVSNLPSASEQSKWEPWPTKIPFEERSKDSDNEYTLNESSSLLELQDIFNKTLTFNEKTHFTVSTISNDASLEYRKLYIESSAENHDFAMNLMAYIEILNDCSWEETFSYFDDNIKRIVKYIWNELKGDFESDTALQTYDCKKLRYLMVQFTDSCLNRKPVLCEFLQYSVELCQFAVAARKLNFKEAPLKVIGFLRNTIKKLKLLNYLPDRFENIVKEYAQNLFTNNQFPFITDARIEKSDKIVTKMPVDYPNIGISKPNSESINHQFLQIPDSQFLSLKPMGVMVLQAEERFGSASQSSLTRLQLEDTFNKAAIFSSQSLSHFKSIWSPISCGQNNDDFFQNEPLPSFQNKAVWESVKDIFSKKDGYLTEGNVLQKKDDINRLTEQNRLSIKNIILSKLNKNRNTARRTQTNKRRKVTMSKKQENNPQIDYSFPNTISLEYKKLYSDASPDNYDFAMNIMAYIELLNDSTWKESVSYLDEAIKSFIIYIWSESKEDSKMNTALQTYDLKMFLNLMVQYTESCLKGKYDLSIFLKYCVEMCQLGVIARQRNIKQGPLRVIGFLRSSERRLMLKNSLQGKFENIVKEYVQNLLTQNQVHIMTGARKVIIDNNVVLGRQPVDCIELIEPMHPSQVTNLQSSQNNKPEFLSSKAVGDSAAGSEGQLFIPGQFSVMNNAKTEPSFETGWDADRFWNDNYIVSGRPPFDFELPRTRQLSQVTNLQSSQNKKSDFSSLKSTGDFSAESEEQLFVPDEFSFSENAENVPTFETACNVGKFWNDNYIVSGRSPFDCLELPKSRQLSKFANPQSSQNEKLDFSSSKAVEDLTVGSEGQLFIPGQFSCIENAKTVTAFQTGCDAGSYFDVFPLRQFKSVNDSVRNDLSSCLGIQNELFTIDPLSMDDREDVWKSIELSSEENELLQQKDCRVLSSGQEIGIDTKFLFFSKEGNISSAALIDESIGDIVNQCLAISDGSNLLGNESPPSICQSANISLRYRQLYSIRHPDKYDFSMNIMAYIEFLNDSSWDVTSSHFDKNVKRMFNLIWNESKDVFESYTVEFHSLHRRGFLDMMTESAELCLGVEYDLDEFLKYCVYMCQLGVIARKSNFKEGPLCVIVFLRNNIKKFKLKYFLADTFENIVKEHAQRLVE